MRRAALWLLLGVTLVAACARPGRGAPPTATVSPSPMAAPTSAATSAPATPQPASIPTPPAVPTPVPLPPDLSSRVRGATRQLPTRLLIPRIDLDSAVVPVGVRLEGDRPVWEVANHAVGYHEGTGVPGQPGNVVLSGHISSRYHGNVFRRLPEVQVGDVAILSTQAGQTLLYQVVERKVVLPTAVEVMDPTPDETLTLITCVPEGVYDHRLIVQAKPASAHASAGAQPRVS